jgi:predicted hydrolase (HD superfamily)
LGKIPSVNEARVILAKYNKEAFHISHGETVSAVLGWFADEAGENADYWRAAGMLHDVDFELFPGEHCVKGEELLKSEGVDESLIRSAMSHGWGLTGTPHEPVSYMEKVLFAVDELTGLIGAVCLMRPSKSALDLETPSVMKKFKDKKFAAGCSRGVIKEGAEKLGVSLEELIGGTIHAMREMEKSSRNENKANVSEML